MINITDRQKCCGCEACLQACPKGCISFIQDEEGFFYPHVDVSLCINCGICERVCPVYSRLEACKPIRGYAAKNLDESVRMESSSGGVFTLLAEYVIRHNGVVFGAKYNESWGVVHDYTESISGISEFRTSKYVQSRIGNSYRDVSTFLCQGRMVLFSGTPCQIAALKNYLRRDYENLLMVDVICHGVPSPKVWGLYLEAIRRESSSDTTDMSHIVDNTRIVDFSFRDKSTGWKNYSVSYSLSSLSDSGEKKRTSHSHVYWENPYMKSFLSNVNLRPSCFCCPAKGGRSGSDFTLGDFWGIDRQMPDYDDDKGVCLLFVNTHRGAAILDSLPISIREVSINSVLINNPLYNESAKPHPCRAKFFRKLKKEHVNVIMLMQSLSQIPFRMKVKNKIGRGIKKIVNMFN